MSMVLVDTSAWIDFFREQSSPCGELVDILLAEGSVCTCKLVLAEIIPAARTRREYERLHDFLHALPILGDPPDLWERVMESGFLLRRKGVNGIGIPDLLIAALALHHHLPVLSKDRHFLAMREHLGLTLFDY